MSTIIHRQRLICVARDPKLSDLQYCKFNGPWSPCLDYGLASQDIISHGGGDELNCSAMKSNKLFGEQLLLGRNLASHSLPFAWCGIGS